MDADRVGCYKTRKIGFPGLACKHCVGQAGCGRYFPATEGSLSQTTTSQTLLNHVRNCRRCPIEIREQLDIMKKAKAKPEYKKAHKPKHGGRKVFFKRLWCRIHRLPIPEVNSDDEPIRRARKGKSTLLTKKKRKRRASSDLGDELSYKDVSNSDMDEDSAEEEEAIETIEFDYSNNFTTVHAPSQYKAKAMTVGQKIYQGRIHLNRGEDQHWLSEAECFIRQELLEVFTIRQEDVKLYSSEPEIGQCGIRCFYCAENKPWGDTSIGVCFPVSLRGVQHAVSDLTKHFSICTKIPEEIRSLYQTMEGYGETPNDEGTVQYWINSARELGLEDSESHGITLFRNPMDNSPADEIAMAQSSGSSSGTIFVPVEERSKCTDQMLLLLNQFEPCQFQLSDRKSSRRDRSIGFPGLACVHCNQKRYFPLNEKKLEDSLQLMTTHINNCPETPLDVKASLGYLQHRSHLQKNELAQRSPAWKFSFLKGVWNRLHQNYNFTTDSSAAATAAAAMDAADISTATSTTVARGESATPEDYLIDEESNDVMEATDTAEFYVEDDAVAAVEIQEEEEEESIEALAEMKDMIKKAALWLSERDDEDYARGGGSRIGRR